MSTGAPRAGALECCMKPMDFQEKVDRGLLIAIALIPACMGLFAFLNNLTGWNETVARMVQPMFSMEGTFGNPAQTWRAIDSMAFANVSYFAVFSIEGLFGLLALAGIASMLRDFSRPAAEFARGVRLVKSACIIAIFVYGFLFFTVGGDWFLAWQNPDLGGLQKDAVNYGITVALAYIVLDSKARSA